MSKPTPEIWNNTDLTLSLLGHSTVLINMYGKWIITDPVLFDKIGLLLRKRKIGMTRVTKSSLSLADIPQIDYVLLSHAHMDHRDMESLAALANQFPDQINFVCPRNTSSLLGSIAYKKSVTELDRYETKEIDGLQIK